MTGTGELAFDGVVVEWRGPAPYLFVPVPEAESEDLRELSAEVSYGWGMIPVRARIGATEFTTSLWPKDGRYLLPVKVAVQRAEAVGEGDLVSVRMSAETR